MTEQLALDHPAPKREPLPSARELLNRNTRAEMLADVLWLTGIYAAQATAMDDEKWGILSDACGRLMPNDFETPYQPSEHTRRLVLAKLTRREMIAQELRRR